MTATPDARIEAAVKALAEGGLDPSPSTARNVVFQFVTEDDVPVGRVRVVVQRALATEALRPHASAERVAAMSAALTAVAEIEKKIDDGEF